MQAWTTPGSRKCRQEAAVAHATTPPLVSGLTQSGINPRRQRRQTPRGGRLPGAHPRRLLELFCGVSQSEKAK